MDQRNEENEEQEFILAEGPSQEAKQTKEERREIEEFSLAPLIQQIQDIRTFIASTRSQL